MLAQLRKEFPDDVRLVYRHFPLPQHEKARPAAEAAEAAGTQGKFWEMYDLLYDGQAQWTKLGAADFRALLKAYARQLRLDPTQFSADLDGGRYTERVRMAFNAAASIPLPYAPFLLFNGVIFQSEPTHAALVTLIKLEQLKARQFSRPPPDLINPFHSFTATLHTAKGDLVLELFPEKAPLTVNNFVFLARAGWYDGVTFHRVIPKIVVQTGDPSGTGYGGPGYLIPNEINADLQFDAAGWVGMMNTGPDTNGSQFFITLAAAPHLDGKCTLFGKVIRGQEVLDKLTPRDPTADAEAPAGDLITSVTIEEK